MSSGIIICAGGKQLLFNASLVVDLIRNFHKSTLPITLFYADEGELDPDKTILTYFHNLNVQTVNASKLNQRLPAKYQYKRLRGWQIKPFCLFHSPYRYTLMLDAEAYPITRPDKLIKVLKQSQSGMILWPDIVSFYDHPCNKLYRYDELRKKGFKFVATPVESGQLLVDNVKHSRTLLACLILNREYEKIYKWVYGDKDTYSWAAELVGANYDCLSINPYCGVKKLLACNFPIAMVQMLNKNEIATMHFSLDPDPSIDKLVTPNKIIDKYRYRCDSRGVIDPPELQLIYAFLNSVYENHRRLVTNVPRVRNVRKILYHLLT